MAEGQQTNTPRGSHEAPGVPNRLSNPQAFFREGAALGECPQLGMRPLQAHCHHGLGTLYARRGQWEQARTELGAALDLYQAMDMTFWLPQVEAVLAQAKER